MGLSFISKNYSESKFLSSAAEWTGFVRLYIPLGSAKKCSIRSPQVFLSLASVIQSEKFKLSEKPRFCNVRTYPCLFIFWALPAFQFLRGCCNHAPSINRGILFSFICESFSSHLALRNSKYEFIFRIPTSFIHCTTKLTTYACYN